MNEIQQKILKTSDISGSQRPQEISRPATVPFQDCVWEDVFVTPMVCLIEALASGGVWWCARLVIAARDAAWCALRDKSNTCGVATLGGEGLRVVRYMLVCRGGALGAVWCVDRCVVCRSLSSADSRLCSHARAYTREQIPHVRPLPPKKIFLPPFRGARFLAERPFSARRRKPCYDFCVGRPGRQAQRPTGKSKHRGERICRTRA